MGLGHPDRPKSQNVCLSQKVKMHPFSELKILQRRNIKRSILESLTSGLRPAAAAVEESQEGRGKVWK